MFILVTEFEGSFIKFGQQHVKEVEVPYPIAGLL